MATFWTIMSTNTPASADRAKDQSRISRSVRHVKQRDPRLRLVEIDSGDHQVFHSQRPRSAAKPAVAGRLRVRVGQRNQLHGARLVLCRRPRNECRGGPVQLLESERLVRDPQARPRPTADRPAR